MNKLLIHNNNTSLNKIELFALSEQFVFEVDHDKDVDFYINDNLSEGDLLGKILNSEIIFIKVSLSQNYLEYLGLRLAYHIRLTKTLGEKANLPIVFIAEESFQYLGLTYSDPSILFTNGIYLIKESIEDYHKIFQWMKEGNIHMLTDKEKFINAININSPANYQSHHSIANEWSILRWSKVIGISSENEALKEITKNIECLLYYKYLHAKHSFELPDKASYKIEGYGNILYIDDEWNKGWNVVLNNFFSKSPDFNGRFIVFEYDFRDKEEELIITDCKKEILTIDPSLIILDLRLADIDFGIDKKTEDLTGYKILQLIKEINPGIRVIVFTASNKVWNLLEVQNAGADSFILKESPEYNINKISTKEAIEQLANTVQEQLRYQFQKDLFVKCKDIKRMLTSQFIEENEEYNKFIKTLRMQLEVINSSLKLINLKKPVTIDITFLSCYNFLELFKSYYLNFKHDYRYYIGIEEEELHRYEFVSSRIKSTGPFVARTKLDKPGWFVTNAALFIDYFKVSQGPEYLEVLNLRRIADNRNAYIHSNKEHFDVSELKLIFESVYNSCKKIRE